MIKYAREHELREEDKGNKNLARLTFEKNSPTKWATYLTPFQVLR